MRITPHKPPSIFTQIIDVLLIELTNWRWSWRGMVLIATLAPLFSILALGFFAQDANSATLAHILTGNVVLSLMFGILDNVQNHFLYMRQFGTLDYFATLPIQKPWIILAVVLGFFLLTLPSLLVIIGVGAWLLGIPLHVSPFALLVVPLCSLPLASLGALIGVTARTPQEGGAITLLLTLVLAAIGPVIAAPERLPPYMLVLGRFSPATYAAAAMRQVLLGPITTELWLDLGVLGTFTVVLFWLALRKMDWRQR